MNESLVLKKLGVHKVHGRFGGNIDFGHDTMPTFTDVEVMRNESTSVCRYSFLKSC